MYLFICVYFCVTVKAYQTLCTGVCVVAAVSYLSVSADFLVLVELDGEFRMLSACVCSVCLSVWVSWLARVCLCACVEVCLLVGLGLHVCECAYRKVQECVLCVCVCITGYGVTAGSSSPQTRPDDEEGSGSASAAVCCAAGNLGHGLGLRLNEK